jgi:hypothetical protein
MVFKSAVKEARGGGKPVAHVSATLVLFFSTAAGAEPLAPDARIRAF